MTEYTKEMHNKHVEERAAAEAKQAAERKEAVIKENARRSWLANGGDPTLFDQAWSEPGGLREQFSLELKTATARATVDQDRQAREQFARSKTNRI